MVMVWRNYFKQHKKSLTKITLGILMFIIGSVVYLYNVYLINTLPKIDVEAKYYVRHNDIMGLTKYKTIGVDYYVDGKLYECVDTGNSDMSINIGDTITIYYNPKNPSKITMFSNLGRNLVLPLVFGTILIILGRIDYVFNEDDFMDILNKQFS